VEAQLGSLYARVEHRYPELLVDLVLYRATIAADEVPRALSAQEVRWVKRAELHALPFCEADQPLLGPLSQERG
jgi:8-oxo-dGTP diphosphatase